MKFQEIILKRGPCYGPCPVYSVTIHNDGSVEWKGDLFVKEEGPRTWSISQKKIDALDKAIDKVKFMELRDKYDEYEVTDHPDATITVKFKEGTKKKVYHYFGDSSVPRVLEWLEIKIDKIAGTEPYVGPDFWEDA